MNELLEPVMGLLESLNPAMLLIALAILPLGGFPASLLLMLLGYKFGELYGESGKIYATILAAIGIGLNDTIAYWLARTFLRGPILRLLERKKIKVPEVPKSQEIRIIALLRVAPGTPLFLQNYALGLAKVDFWRYLWISLPIQMIHAAALIFCGDSIFKGETGTIIIAVSMMIVLVIIFRMVHSQHKAREAKRAAKAG